MFTEFYKSAVEHATCVHILTLVRKNSTLPLLPTQTKKECFLEEIFKSFFVVAAGLFDSRKELLFYLPLLG